MSDPTLRRAQCSCGQLTATARGEPVRISVCHCLACQRRSGSVFAAQVRFPRANVDVSGRASEFTRIGDSGESAARFRFCPKCGATVYYTIDKDPERIAIPVGAFADPTFPAPTFSVYEARRHAWVSIPGDDVEHWD